MRLDNREDLGRAKNTLELFDEPWWAVIVYSCFDSEVGTSAVAPHFRRPITAQEATSRLTSAELPRGSVQHHRTQPGNKGAKLALVAACDLAAEFEAILRDSNGFHERYEALRGLKATQWGRTTCFDLLIRAGMLTVTGVAYRPDRAYLQGSTGPSKGFEAVWGIEVTPRNSDACENLLCGWTERWSSIANRVGVPWAATPYDSGDLENALCVFQEPEIAGYRKFSVDC